jgi:hypothetical protein
MKIIKYKMQSGDELIEVTLGYNETSVEIAKAEAYNGEYTIEDDGQPELVAEPTQLDRVEAQTTYTAMMTGTLLEV